MTDFIHLDDSDLDLEEILGEYTDYDDVCFSDDVWSDGNEIQHDVIPTRPEVQTENTKREKGKSDSKTTRRSSVIYDCPLCKRTYKSIVGFRGHVSKKHDRSDLKAHEHRRGINKDTTPLASRGSPLPSTPLSTESKVHDALTGILPNAIAAIIQDPMMDGDCSVNGPHLFQVGKDVRDNMDTRSELIGLISSTFCHIFTGFGQGSLLSSDREVLWRRFHQARLDRQFVSNLRECIHQSTSESLKMVHVYAQSLLDRTMRGLIQFWSDSIQTESEIMSTHISDNDQSVLYYISGYILHVVSRKPKISGHDVEPVLASLSTTTESKETYIQKFTTWTDKINRGGLTLPSDNFFLFIRSIETNVRSNVHLSSLCASSLQCDKLKENILTNFMVLFYWDKLVACKEELKVKLLEFIVNLYLRIRGRAVAKYTKRPQLKVKKCEKKVKSSHSLRKALKCRDNLGYNYCGHKHD